MTTVLGIDAAWTAGEPSGVALVQRQASRWHCVAAAPSYAAFTALAEGHAPDWSRPATGSAPDIPGLLQAAAALASEAVTLVTIDMPVATSQGSKTAHGRKRSPRERADLDGENVVVAWVDTASPPPHATVPIVMYAGIAGLTVWRDGRPSRARRPLQAVGSTRNAQAGRS